MKYEIRAVLINNKKKFEDIIFKSKNTKLFYGYISNHDWLTYMEYVTLPFDS